MSASQYIANLEKACHRHQVHPYYVYETMAGELAAPLDAPSVEFTTGRCSPHHEWNRNIYYIESNGQGRFYATHHAWMRLNESIDPGSVPYRHLFGPVEFSELARYHELLCEALHSAEGHPGYHYLENTLSMDRITNIVGNNASISKLIYVSTVEARKDLDKDWSVNKFHRLTGGYLITASSISLRLVLKKSPAELNA